MALNDFFKKVTDTTGNLGKKTADNVEIAKLSNQVRKIASTIDAEYKKLGEASYKAYKTGEADDTLTTICEGIAKLEEKIGEINEQISVLKDEKRCPGCGALLKRDLKFCPHCGTKQPELKTEEKVVFVVNEDRICPDCGTKLDKDDQFCKECGHKFGEEKAEEPEAADEPEKTEE